MRDETGPANPELKLAGRLRAAGVMALSTGSAGSLAFTMWVGRRNPSRALMAMVVIWVLSPFVGLAVAYAVSRRWRGSVEAALVVLTLVLTLCSLTIYGLVALGPPRPKPAAFFLVVPAASWLLIALVGALAAIISRKPSN